MLRNEHIFANRVVQTALTRILLSRRSHFVPLNSRCQHVLSVFKGTLLVLMNKNQWISVDI